MLNREIYQTAELRARELLLRQMIIPPNLLGVVFRRGELARFIEPRRPNRRPRLGLETLLGFICLDTQQRPFTIRHIMSLDGHRFTVSGRVNYIFDPRICPDPAVQTEYILRYFYEPAALHQPLDALLTRHLHNIIGRKTAWELLNGEAVTTAEQRLTRRICHDLKRYGIQLDPLVGIVLEKITPPASIAEAHQKGLTHWLEVISGLEELTAEQLERLTQLRLIDRSHINIIADQSHTAALPIVLPPAPPSAQNGGIKK